MNLSYRGENSLTMMAMLWGAFVLVNVIVVQADSATGENKQRS